MQEYTNRYGMTFKVGQVGTLTRRFKMHDGEKLTITGFTPTGRFMHTENERGTRYSFTTESQILRGSHMGNCKITF